MNAPADPFPPAVPPADCAICGRATTEHAPHCPQREREASALGYEHLGRGIDKRVATILHCDVDAAVRIGQSVDLETYHEFMQSVLDCIRRAVHRNRPQGGSSYDRATGDSVLFCFGLPLASESDAIDAVSAAISAVAAARAIPVPDGIVPEFRIGVATGPVVFSVGTEPDEGSTPEVTGVAPNLAARLQSVTPGGTVVICETTYAIVSRRFLCEPLGLFDLKGLGERHAWQVRERRHSPTRSARTGHHPSAPMVGRSSELTAMLDRWRDACGGTAGAVLVRGEAGVGKSRLLHEFKTCVAGEDILVMDVRCSRAHRDSAFHAIADYLERTFRLPPAGPDGARQARLTEIFVDRFGLAPDDLPQVAGFLTPAGFDAGTTNAAQAKARRDDAMRSMISLLRKRVRAHRAAVAFVEDVHWADSSSLDFLCRIIREADRLNLLFVFSARPEFDPKGLTGFPLDHVDLEPLTVAESATLLRKIDVESRIPPSVIELVVSRCDGIPLYLSELTRNLLDRVAHDVPVELREAALLDAVKEVPPTLRGLLNARLDRSLAARSVAQAAAAIGREFPLALLQAVAPMPSSQLQQGLAELLDATLILDTSADQCTTYAFRHALIQDAAYDSLLDRPRRQLHMQIADALAREDSGVPLAPPAVIAQHYSEARKPREAIHHWVRASHHAADRSDNEEAASHLYRAIALAAALDDPGEAAEVELDLRARLVPSLLAAHGYASEHVARNAAQATALFPRARNPEPKIVILRTECSWAIVRAEYGRAAHLSGEITRLATQTGEPGLTLDAFLLSGLVNLYRGQLPSARRHLEQCRWTYEPSLHAGYSQRLGVDIGSAAPAYLSRVLWLLGDARGAERAAVEAVAHAAVSPIPLAETQAQGMKMLLHLAAGDIDAVRVSAGRTLELAQRRGQLYWERLVNVVTAWLDTLTVATPQALLAVERGVHDYRSTGSRLGLSWLLLLRADVEHRAGLPRQALATSDEALDFVRDSEERYYLPEIHRFRAKLYWLALGRPDLARHELDRAVDTADEQGAVAWRTKAEKARNELRRVTQGKDPSSGGSLLLS